MIRMPRRAARLDRRPLAALTLLLVALAWSGGAGRAEHDIDAGRAVSQASRANGFDAVFGDSGRARLRRVLERYRQIAMDGGWPLVPAGPVLAPGDQNARVAILRARLRAAGDMAAADTGRPNAFDGDLEGAVRAFQARHGLAADGLVGPATLAVLNASVEDRIGQIEANLARWSDAPAVSGRWLFLNAADFRLDLIEADRIVRSLPAIVGRPDRPTPVMSGRITHLVLSPFWHVPTQLAVLDQLPLIRRDSGYLARMHMRVYPHTGTREIDPRTIDWDTVSVSGFPFRLVQDPGSHNALGPAKFVFPNLSGVMLHGTPDSRLFERRRRALSSGCVRIEDPLALAEHLLRDRPRALSRAKLEDAVAVGTEQIVAFGEPIPIFLDYRTAWVDAGGSLQLREDVYARDRPAH